MDDQELTARFILSSRHINKRTKTLKGDAFVPHPYAELSVTRHIAMTEQELWSIGAAIAAQRTPPRTLRGRGDVLAATYRWHEELDVLADPVDGNPNHASVVGWPPHDESARQLLIAKEIASIARFVPFPPEDANEAPT